MITGINVDLTIRDNTTGEYLRIPVVPATIPYSEGEKLADTKKILNLGDVEFLNGEALDAMEWQSFFPARYDPGYCAHSDLRAPTEYRDQFRAWKSQGASLQIICPAAGINTEMRIAGFQWELRGFEGDIYYFVSFKQRRMIRPRQIAVEVNAETQVITAAKTKTAQDRPAIPETTKPKTYTVKSGDNLTLIAKKHGIASWRTIYEANKAVIGSNPNLIYPGQVLTL